MTPDEDLVALKAVAENARMSWPEPHEWRDDGGWFPDEALHIKTFDPPTVLALLSRIEQLVRERDDTNRQRCLLADRCLSEAQRAQAALARVAALEKGLERLRVIEAAARKVQFSAYPAYGSASSAKPHTLAT